MLLVACVETCGANTVVTQARVLEVCLAAWEHTRNRCLVRPFALCYGFILTTNRIHSSGKDPDYASPFVRGFLALSSGCRAHARSQRLLSTYPVRKPH